MRSFITPLISIVVSLMPTRQLMHKLLIELIAFKDMSNVQHCYDDPDTFVITRQFTLDWKKDLEKNHGTHILFSCPRIIKDKFDELTKLIDQHYPDPYLGEPTEISDMSTADKAALIGHDISAGIKEANEMIKADLNQS